MREGKFSVARLDQKAAWLEWLARFPKQDVYYLPGYYHACCTIEEGDPCVAYFENRDGRVYYPFLERELTGLKWLGADYSVFRGYKDITTPYGYGGPLLYAVEGREGAVFAAFRKYFDSYCRRRNILCEFVRFHPVLNNHRFCLEQLDCNFNRYTVAIELRGGAEGILAGMSSKCRNSMRKSRKSGVAIDFSSSDEDLRDFIRLYHATMDKLKADEYYYFDEDYFFAVASGLKGNMFLVNARFETQKIASALMLHHGGRLNYHLAGSNPQYSHLAANNLLLFEAACYGATRGFTSLHLGGGYGATDTLFAFKKSFAPAGICEFWTGSKVHLKEEYEYLAKLWSQRFDSSAIGERYFPIYRAVPKRSNGNVSAK